MASLEDLRKKLQADQEKSKKFENNTGDGATYPFWNLEMNGQSVIRFLPDGNPDAQTFWVEKSVIKIPFAGIVGKNTTPTTVQVPCLWTWGDKCPIQDEIKPLWKTDKATATKYWARKTYLFHGTVRKDGIKDGVVPENPIRRFTITKQLFALIHAGLMDPEMKYIPTDFQNGTDFTIVKTKNGEFADYGTSKWSRNYSPLTEEEALAIEKYSIPDLTTYLPNRPSAKEVDITMEMFISSMNGEAYDPDRFGAYFKPYGLDDNKAETGAGTHTVSTSVAETVSTPETQPETPQVAAETTSGTTKPSVADLLAQLKKKQATA